MGAIVSSKLEITADDSFPSAVTAAQAKMRHEMLKEYFQSKSDEEEGASDDTTTQVEWYPPGISSGEYAQCAVSGPPGSKDDLQIWDMEWMDAHSLSTKHLHKAAAQITTRDDGTTVLQKEMSSDSLPPSSLLKQDNYFSPRESLHLEKKMPPSASASGSLNIPPSPELHMMEPHSRTSLDKPFLKYPASPNDPPPHLLLKDQTLPLDKLSQEMPVDGKNMPAIKMPVFSVKETDKRPLPLDKRPLPPKSLPPKKRQPPLDTIPLPLEKPSLSPDKVQRSPRTRRALLSPHHLSLVTPPNQSELAVGSSHRRRRSLSAVSLHQSGHVSPPHFSTPSHITALPPPHNSPLSSPHTSPRHSRTLNPRTELKSPRVLPKLIPLNLPLPPQPPQSPLTRIHSPPGVVSPLSFPSRPLLSPHRTDIFPHKHPLSPSSMEATRPQPTVLKTAPTPPPKPELHSTVLSFPGSQSASPKRSLPPLSPTNKPGLSPLKQPLSSPHKSPSPPRKHPLCPHKPLPSSHVIELADSAEMEEDIVEAKEVPLQEDDGGKRWMGVKRRRGEEGFHPTLPRIESQKKEGGRSDRGHTASKKKSVTHDTTATHPFAPPHSAAAGDRSGSPHPNITVEPMSNMPALSHPSVLHPFTSGQSRRISTPEPPHRRLSSSVSPNRLQYSANPPSRHVSTPVNRRVLSTNDSQNWRLSSPNHPSSDNSASRPFTSAIQQPTPRYYLGPPQRSLSVSSLPLRHQSTLRELQRREEEMARARQQMKGRVTTPIQYTREGAEREGRPLRSSSGRRTSSIERDSSMLKVQGTVYQTQSETSITSDRRRTQYWLPGFTWDGMGGIRDKELILSVAAADGGVASNSEEEEGPEEEEEEDLEDEVEEDEGGARVVPPPTYGENSILIAPPDDDTLMRAGEFRGDAINHLHHLTSTIRLDYFRFVSDYDQTLYYAAQQVEARIKDYYPQTVLLISSTVPKASVLKAAALPNVLVHIYDYHSETPEGLLDQIHELLESYRPKAKAKYIGIVCKGGPGHFYLIKNMPVTPAKIRNNKSLLDFWMKVGEHMSKLFPGESVIHLMESNVAGNRQGEELLKDLEYAMYSHQVKIQSPLELSPSGRTMLALYFDMAKHKLWKAKRYTKYKLYKSDSS